MDIKIGLHKLFEIAFVFTTSTVSIHHERQHDW